MREKELEREWGKLIAMKTKLNYKYINLIIQYLRSQQQTVRVLKYKLKFVYMLLSKLQYKSKASS